MKRTAMDRLNAIPVAVANADAFKLRVAGAATVLEAADLMAEAIQINRDARPLEIVSKDGRQFFCMEELLSMHCMDAAAAKYRELRQSNQ